MPSSKHTLVNVDPGLPPDWNPYKTSNACYGAFAKAPPKPTTPGPRRRRLTPPPRASSGPRIVSTEYPRYSRGVAATRLQGISNRSKAGARTELGLSRAGRPPNTAALVSRAVRASRALDLKTLAPEVQSDRNVSNNSL